MNRSRIGTGLFFITIGTILLLFQYGILNYTFFTNVLRFWPLFLIVGGLGMMVGRTHWIRPLLWLILILFFVYMGLMTKQSDRFILRHSPSSTLTPRIEVAKEPEVQSASLQLNTGAQEFSIQAGVNQLVEGKSDSEGLSYFTQKKGNRMYITVNRENQIPFSQGIQLQACELSLHKGIPWDISLNTGLTRGTLNLSELMINELNVNTGLTSLNVTIGSTSPMTKINLHSGLSNLKLFVPKGMGIQVSQKGALTSFHAPNFNFTNISEELHQTENYSSAKNKLVLNLEAALGEVELYPIAEGRKAD